MIACTSFDGIHVLAALHGLEQGVLGIVVMAQPQSAVICTLSKPAVQNHDDARSLVNDALEGKEHLIFKAGAG